MRTTIILMALLYVAGVGYARTVFIGPDNCAPPADIEIYAPEGVEANDLNEWRRSAEVSAVVEANVAETPQGDKVIAWLSPGMAKAAPTAEAAPICGDKVSAQ